MFPADDLPHDRPTFTACLRDTLSRIDRAPFSPTVPPADTTGETDPPTVTRFEVGIGGGLVFVEPDDAGFALTNGDALRLARALMKAAARKGAEN